jgi:hypothetical protein
MVYKNEESINYKVIKGVVTPMEQEKNKILLEINLQEKKIETKFQTLIVLNVLNESIKEEETSD